MLALNQHTHAELIGVYEEKGQGMLEDVVRSMNKLNTFDVQVWSSNIMHHA